MSDFNKKYFAFISYSHRDKKWADWLHTSLETYKVPKALVGSEGRDGTVPKRVFPIFRDREELPTSADLGANINNALENSNYLIVICSPNSAKSQWVNEEILSWKRLGKENKILCLIVDGEPNATDMGQPDDECFPQALKFKVGDNLELTTERTEPIAADAREHADGKSNAKLKLLAGLLGVNYDSLKQREKRRQTRTRIMYAVLASTMSIIAVAYWQYAQNLNNEKLISESISLASASKEALAKGNSSKAMQLALQALPDDINNAQRPYVAEAEAALSQAMYQHKELFSIQAHQGKITSSIFSPDNRLLITSGEDWKVKVWDMTTHKLIKELVEHKASIIRVVHHEEKNILISWDSEGQLIVWNTSDWSIKGRLNHYTIKYVKDVEFSADGRYLIAGKLVWDLEKNSQFKLDFDQSLKKLDIDNLFSIKGTSKLIAQAKNHLLLFDLESRTIISQYEIPLVKGEHLGDMKSLVVLEGSGLLFFEFAYKNYLLNANDLSINRTIELKINRVLGYKVESQELICIIDNELQLWNLVTNQTQKLNDKNEKYYNAAKINLLNSNKGVIVQDSNLINIIDLASGSVTARYESGLAVGDLYTSDSVIRDISTNENESLMSMALIDGRVKIFDLSLLKHQVFHKLGSKIKRFKKSINKLWVAIYLENKDLILVDIENQTLKTISTNVEINDFDFALSDRKIIMLLDTKAISLDVVNTDDAKILYPFNGLLELAKDFELSKSKNTLMFTSTNSQLASYDLKSNKWLKQSIVTRVQSVSNLGSNWVVKTSNSSMSHFNSDFSKGVVQVLPSTALNSLYYTQYTMSSDKTKAVWLDNDGYVVYWDVAKESQIFSIKLSNINNSFFELSGSGNELLIGNDSEVTIYSSLTGKSTYKLIPKTSEDASFSNAFFESESNHLSVVEKYSNKGRATSIIYKVELKTNDVVWKSNVIAGDLKVLNESSESIILSNSKDILIYYRKEHSLKNISSISGMSAENIARFSSDNKMFVANKNEKLSLWKVNSKKPEWEEKIPSKMLIFISPDGKYIANVYNYRSGGVIEIIDSSSGSILAKNYQHSGLVYGFTKSNHLISWQANSSLCKWDWQHNRNSFVKDECRPQLFNNAHVNIQNNDVYVLNHSSTYQFYDSTKQKLITELSCESSRILNTLRINSESLICASTKEDYVFFDVNKMVKTRPFITDTKIGYIQTSLNGRYVVAVDIEGNISAGDIRKQNDIKIILTAKDIVRVQIDDLGRYLSVLKKNWQLELWDTKTAKILSTIQLPANNISYLGQFDLLLSEEKQSLLVFATGDVYVWNPDNLKPLSNFKIQNIQYTQVKINLKDKRIVQLGHNGIDIWDWQTSQKLKSYDFSGYTINDKSIVMLNELSKFSILHDDKLVLYDLLSAKEVGHIKIKSYGKLIYSPSKKLVAMKTENLVSSQNEVQIWNLETFKKVSQLPIQYQDKHFVFLTDEAKFAVISTSGMIKTWDISEQSASMAGIHSLSTLDKDWIVKQSKKWPLNSLNIHSPTNSSTVALIDPPRVEQSWFGDKNVLYKMSNNGRYVISQDSNNSLKLFNLDELKKHLKITGIIGKLIKFEVYKDSQEIVTLSDNGAMQVWSIATGSELFRLSSGSSDTAVSSVGGVSINNNKNAVSYFGKKLSIWNLENKKLLGEFDISNTIIAAQADSAFKNMMVLDSESTLKFMPLQPNGQNLINKARELVN